MEGVNATTKSATSCRVLPVAFTSILHSIYQDRED
jgi:hypothetical protein